MENKNKNKKLFICVVETIIVMLLLGFIQDPYVLALSLLATILIIFSLIRTYFIKDKKIKAASDSDDEDGKNPSDK